MFSLHVGTCRQSNGAQQYGGGSPEECATVVHSDERNDGTMVELRSRRTRSINDVLVEPGVGVAPTKRRRGKAKRSKDISQTGTIQHYFAKLCTQKEWSKNWENDGATVDGGGGGAGKRKLDSFDDGSIQQRKLEKSRRTMVEVFHEYVSLIRES